MEELATKVVQYIQEEFRRLSIGGSTSSGASNDSFNQGWWDTFYTHCDQQARQQRSSYDNYRQQRFTRNSSNPRSSWGSHGASFAQNDGCHHPPDATNARIWIIQSRADLGSVERLFDTRDGLNWLICFQCSQVVEKALKAALYAVCGISDDQLESHDLIRLASDLKSVPRGPDVLQSAGELRNYHDPTRYPHKHVPAKPPKDVYTSQQAHDAYEIAKKLLQVLEEFIGILRI
jgi:HEPN domain-containing protein